MEPRIGILTWIRNRPIGPFPWDGKGPMHGTFQTESYNPSHMADLDYRKLLAFQWMIRVSDPNPSQRLVEVMCITH